MLTGRAEMNRTIVVEDEIDRQIEHIRDAMDLAGEPLAALPGRQILQIRTARYHTAGFIPSAAGRPTSQAYIVFTGEPTPSSDVTRGILRFVSDDELQTPSYDAAQKTIQIWVDWTYVHMVIEQLKHRRHYLWIGFFEKGHTYGDLHSDP
ncbi:hypothetical protein [Tropicimonas sp. IMCC6043]|uniref:hypothetical protein n=1 Tax=Tropicimonas sp. IMCC6043 TaxID=2510645 RepID=UPI00101C96EC|nr:hypothetical protein [Tropicimonas sp. IMCC6043]RYH07920.1 hypothetical protein EU800_18275 [Tropicimonas sp. IMCC6043]